MAKKKKRSDDKQNIKTDNFEIVSDVNDVQARDIEAEASSLETNSTDSRSIPDDRTDERRVVAVNAIVQLKESDTERYKEMVEVSEISKNGAGFTLSRECGIGRLLSLVIDMPTELRAYDHHEEVYPVLGVVQTCYPTTVEGNNVFRVGVAFVGKDMPEGFKADPRQCYRLIGRRPDGLWQMVEAEREFKRRKFSRFWRQFEVSLLVRDESTRTSDKFLVSTRDVSASGMSVWGEIDAQIGDRVKITSADHEFFSMAVLKNKVVNEKDPLRSTYHFEFEGAAFPVERLHVQSVPEEKPDRVPAQTPEPSAETFVHVSDPGNSGDVVRF